MAQASTGNPALHGTGTATLSGNTDSPKRHGSSLIGPGTQIDGSVIFAGTLHLRGEIRGDVNCDGTTGTIIVGETGRLDGSLAAPQVVVKGRVRGPIEASQRIEFHAGSIGEGDIRYRTLEIHAGGRIDGLLTPTEVPALASPARLPRPASAETPAPALAPLAAPTPRRLPDSPRNGGGARTLWMAAAAIAVVVAIFVVTREDPAASRSPIAALQAPANATAAGTELANESRATAPTPAGAREEAPAAPSSAPAPAAQLPPARPAAGAPKAPAEPATAAAKETERAAPVERPEPDAARALTIKGVNAERPANVLFIVTREPVVIYKKKAEDTANGVRLEFPRGRNTRIRISPEELLRVAQGEDLDLFFQGGKVLSQPIASGSWMRFEALDPPPPAKPATPRPAAPTAESSSPAPASASPATPAASAGGTTPRQ
jgi:cytoskeletal protein CcmA (bactofilin family)